MYTLGIENVVINAGDGFDYFNIDSTLVGTTNTFRGGGDDDTFYLSTTAADITSSFGGSVVIDGQGALFPGGNAITVNDSFTAFDANWTINETTIDKANAFPTTPLLTYSNVGGIERVWRRR